MSDNCPRLPIEAGIVPLSPFKWRPSCWREVSDPKVSGMEPERLMTPRSRSWSPVSELPMHDGMVPLMRGFRNKDLRRWFGVSHNPLESGNCTTYSQLKCVSEHRKVGNVPDKLFTDRLL